MIKNIVLVFVLLLIVPVVAGADQSLFPNLVPLGEEITDQEKGYKFSNNNNIILGTPTHATCYWDDPKQTEIDCEAVIEIKNNNVAKQAILNPDIQLTFADGKKVNSFEYFYSDVTEIVKKEFYNKETKQLENFTKNNFSDWKPLPSSLATNKPGAIKVKYKTKKYSENQFNVTLSHNLGTMEIDPIQSSCATIGASGVYTVNQSVSSATTCFTINAHHVAIQCLGWDSSISYGSNGFGAQHGVTGVSVKQNITVRNCNITEGVNGGSGGDYGIKFTNNDNSFIYNNTITTFSLESDGMYISSGTGGTRIYNNTVRAWQGNGFSFAGASYDWLYNNTFIVPNTTSINAPLSFTGTTVGHGIFNNNFLTKAVHNKSIIDGSLSARYKKLWFNNSYGYINWTDDSFQDNLSVVGNLSLGGTVIIKNNTVALDQSIIRLNDGGINSSASILLLGNNFSLLDTILRVDYFTNSTKEILLNGTDCIAGGTCKLNRFSSKQSINFTVTGWSSFGLRSLDTDPEIRYRTPLNNTIFAPSETVNLNFSIFDSPGEVFNITLYASGDNPPLTVVKTWTNVPQDNFSFWYSLASASDSGTFYWYINVMEHSNSVNSEIWRFTMGGIQIEGALPIALFVLFVAGGLIALPFFKKKFSTNQFVDIIMRRSCWIIGIYLMMLNAAIMASIANAAGLDLAQEMFTYMWLFGTAGWIFIGFVMLKTLIDLTKMWKIQSQERRFGDK